MENNTPIQENQDEKPQNFYLNNASQQNDAVQSSSDSPAEQSNTPNQSDNVQSNNPNPQNFYLNNASQQNNDATQSPADANSSSNPTNPQNFYLRDAKQVYAQAEKPAKKEEQPTNFRQYVWKKTPKGVTAVNTLDHIGRILSNLAIFGVFFQVFSGVTQLLSIAWYMMLIVIAVASVGIVLLPPFNSVYFPLWNASSYFLEFATKMLQAWYIIGPITLILAALSIGFLFANRKNLSKWRIGVSISILVISAIIMIIFACTRGA